VLRPPRGTVSPALVGAIDYESEEAELEIIWTTVAGALCVWGSSAQKPFSGSGGCAFEDMGNGVSDMCTDGLSRQA
jgi:hypothetical protein